MSQHRPRTKVAALVALAVGGLLVATAPLAAMAASRVVVAHTSGVWSPAIEPAGFSTLNQGGYSEILSMSCGSPGNCTGVGDFRDVAHSERTQALIVNEVHGKWGSAFKAPGTAKLNAGGFAQLYTVSCAAPGYCVAGGGYRDAHGGFQAFLVDEVHGSWQSAFEVPGSAALNAGGTASIKSVSCASIGNCSAGGHYVDGFGHAQALVVSEVGGTWGTASELAGSASLNIDGNAVVESMSCPAPGECVAGGSYKDGSLGFQGFLAVEASGVWSNAFEVPGTSSLNKGALASVSQVWCSSVGNCSAGGTYRDATFHNLQAFVVTEAHGTWGDAIEVPGLGAMNAGGAAHLYALSCGGAASCAAGGSYLDASKKIQSFLVDEVNGHWGGAFEVPGTAALNVTSGGEGVASISCSAPGTCSAAGDYGDASGGAPVYVVNETAGRWGSAVEAPGTAQLNKGDSATIFQVACTAQGSCVAGGNYRSGGGQYEVFVMDYYPTPVVTSVAPSAGPTRGGTPTVIHGSHLAGVTEVLFGARRATGLRLVNLGALRVIVPPGSGTVMVRVRTQGGFSPPSPRARFVYARMPVVRALGPATGSSRGGERVEIRGANLGGVIAVLFGGRRATHVVTVNPDVLRVSAPRGGGRVDVRVVTHGGVSSPSPRDWFTYHR